METTSTPHTQSSNWYRYGVIFIFIQAGIAILQTFYALYMVLSGAGGFGGGH
jgi:hypothetical protein